MSITPQSRLAHPDPVRAPNGERLTRFFYRSAPARQVAALSTSTKDRAPLLPHEKASIPGAALLTEPLTSPSPALRPQPMHPRQSTQEHAQPENSTWLNFYAGLQLAQFRHR